MRAHKYVIKLNEKRKRILYGISTNVTFSPLITTLIFKMPSAVDLQNSSNDRDRGDRRLAKEKDSVRSRIAIAGVQWVKAVVRV